MRKKRLLKKKIEKITITLKFILVDILVGGFCGENV